MTVCMNNTDENDCFGFPKVKWLRLTDEVDKSQICKIFMSNFLMI